MNCPRCEHYELVEQVRDGVRIDHCARCRGIWLDRGELERLLLASREDEQEPGPAALGTDQGRDYQRRHDDDDDDDDDRRRSGGSKPRRRWLDLLDFG